MRQKNKIMAYNTIDKKTKLRILYWCAGRIHLRMLVPVAERDDIIQAVVINKDSETDSIKIKTKYKYNNISDIKKVIDDFKPHVFIQYTGNRGLVDYLNSRRIMVIFAFHGVVASSISEKEWMTKDANFYKKFDMICGATHRLIDLFKKDIGVDNVPIVTDVLTQFDLLYSLKENLQTNYKKISRDKKKVITFFGHNISTKTEKLRPYDEGHKKAIFELLRLSEKHKDWVIYIKPKSTKGLPKSKDNFFVLKHDDNPYQYFSSDLLIVSARSTVEVEASLLNKPLIRVHMPTSKLTEENLSCEIGALDFGASYIVSEINELEGEIIKSFDGKHDQLFLRQNEFIRHLGISFDGKAHERLICAIKNSLYK